VWFAGSFTSVLRGQYEVLWIVAAVVVVVFIVADSDERRDTRRRKRKKTIVPMKAKRMEVPMRVMSVGAEMLGITRLPRTIALVLAGAAMSMSGLVMQLLTGTPGAGRGRRPSCR
jgi:ABC-type enterochelin transport system permease subunit